MKYEEIITSLEKVSANLNYMLLDDAFDATKEERTSEITETNLRLRSCIEALKLRLHVVGSSTGALFSDCHKYRYVLWRVWDDSLPKVMFIGLNPSTANEDSDDPTIRRVKTFAKTWGFGGVYMLNLFTYITAYPEELKKCDDPLGPADYYLMEYAQKSEKIIFAWGNFKECKERAKEVRFLLAACNTYMLIQNKDGSPRHPLYVPGNVVPVRV